MMSDSKQITERYHVLKSESIMMIGEQHPSRVLWLQFYDATNSFEEEDIRELMIEISQHITKGAVPSGSARKFLDGKLIYYESPPRDNQLHPKVYAIFTNQIENIYSEVKKAVEAVATRGGVYSAQRFFSEVIDILEDPERLEIYEKIASDQTLRNFDEATIGGLSLNELGMVISHLNHSNDLDFLTLEKIYYHIHDALNNLSRHLDMAEDPDEFLDAAYIVAVRYAETDNFHLALELFKQIIPIAINNNRYDLTVACRIQIGIIYKDYFPMSGEYILKILEPIDENDLNQTNNRLLEIFYCLQGYAYRDLNNEQKALQFYKSALNVAEQNINSPFWIAEAYYYLGEVDRRKYYLKDASRFYLTAAAIAFSTGDLTITDKYRNKAAESEILIAYSITHAALVHRMEMDHKDAEYRAWESLRLMIKSYQHSMIGGYQDRRKLAEEIIKFSRNILKLPGKQKINREIIDEIEQLILLLHREDFEAGDEEQERLLRVSKLIEENIPLPPATFMLLSVDGRLMTMGRITDVGWEKSDLEGTLLSGILSAIMSMISEVSEEDSSLRTIDAGNVQIMIEQTDNVVAVLLVDRDIQEFRNRLIQLLKEIDNKLGDKLKFWDGGTKIFDQIKKKVQELLAPSVVAATMDNY